MFNVRNVARAFVSSVETFGLRRITDLVLANISTNGNLCEVRKVSIDTSQWLEKLVSSRVVLVARCLLRKSASGVVFT